MATLITEAFGGTLGNWNPASPAFCSISSGALLFSAEGGLIHKTSAGTGDKWWRYRILSTDSNALIVLGADSSGNFTAMQLVGDYGGSNTYELIKSTWYTTYSTYVSEGSESNQDSGVAFGAAKYVGVTLDKANKVVRLWGGVTAAEPTSLTSWDSRAADASQTFTQALPGDYIGLGSWGATAPNFDDFTAGDFGGGGNVSLSLPNTGGTTTSTAARGTQTPNLAVPL